MFYGTDEEMYDLSGLANQKWVPLPVDDTVLSQGLIVSVNTQVFIYTMLHVLQVTMLYLLQVLKCCIRVILSYIIDVTLYSVHCKHVQQVEAHVAL